MIESKDLSKNFDDVCAVNKVSLKIDEGRVFGLIGTNGAGKSTFLRMAAGVIKPDEGSVTIDKEEVFENPKVKENFFYISDDLYFFNNGTPNEMASFYSTVYKTFDKARYSKLMDNFGLDPKRKINTFSKGMKKQLAVILGLSSMTKYMFCDETFDGLDPVMRQGVKSLFASDIADRGFTPIIASHNLRELEDICDSVGLLHNGGIILSEDLDNIKSDVHKIQCVLNKDINKDEFLAGLNVVNKEERGSLLTLTVRGRREEIINILSTSDPIFMEVLPLSLEEIFISETGVEGYDFKKIIL